MLTVWILFLSIIFGGDGMCATAAPSSEVATITFDKVEQLFEKQKSYDVELVAHNLRFLLGKTISSALAKRIVMAFRDGRKWRHLLSSEGRDLERNAAVKRSRNAFMRGIHRKRDWVQTAGKEVYGIDSGIRGGLSENPRRSLDDIIRDIKRFLVRAGLLSQERVAMISIEQVDGGASTEKLFLIKNEKGRTIFVLKTIIPYNENEEVKNLYHLMHHPDFHAVGKLRDPTMLQIAQVEGIYFYKDYWGQRRYFLLLHGARLISLENIFKRIGEHDHLLPIDQDIATRLGVALANFHKHYMVGEGCPLKGGSGHIAACRTVTHGDFHTGNIFVDDEYITVIDNESIAQTIDPISRGNLVDDHRTLFRSFQYLGSRSWRTEFLGTFLGAYIATMCPENAELRDQLLYMIASTVIVS